MSVQVLEYGPFTGATQLHTYSDTGVDEGVSATVPSFAGVFGYLTWWPAVALYYASVVSGTVCEAFSLGWARHSPDNIGSYNVTNRYYTAAENGAAGSIFVFGNTRNVDRWYKDVDGNVVLIPEHWTIDDHPGISATGAAIGGAKLYVAEIGGSISAYAKNDVANNWDRESGSDIIIGDGVLDIAVRGTTLWALRQTQLLPIVREVFPYSLV